MSEPVPPTSAMKVAIAGGESSHTTRIAAGWEEARRLSNEVIPKMAQQAMDAVVAERVVAEKLASALRSLVGESWHRGSALGCQSQKNIDAARAVLAEFTSAQPESDRT